MVPNTLKKKKPGHKFHNLKGKVIWLLLLSADIA